MSMERSGDYQNLKVITLNGIDAVAGDSFWLLSYEGVVHSWSNKTTEFEWLFKVNEKKNVGKQISSLISTFHKFAQVLEQKFEKFI